MAVYVPDKAGFTRLATSQGVRKHMLFIGNYWAAELRTLAPTLFEHNTGEYVGSIKVRSITVSIGKLPRAAVEISANTRYAAILEIGSHDIDYPPRPLTKLLDRIEDADAGQARKHRK